MPCMDCPTTIPTTDGTPACPRCVAPGHTQCPGCRTWYPQGLACPSCVTCQLCLTTVTGAEATQTTRAETICGNCRNDGFWLCEDCDGWSRVGTECGNGCHDPGACDCADCADDEDVTEYHQLVHEYSYKPRPVFHGSGPLYLGPEIEVAIPDYRDDECARIAVTHLGSLGYLKADTSIGHGFEIVTHPMSYEWALAHFPWRMLAELHHAGCAATDETGLHIHVSRAGFSSTCHTYRWMKFIYRNQHQVTALAGRTSAQWARFSEDDRRAVKDYAKGATGDRYRAINTNNTDTFELRIFASSLDPQRVRALFGFAAASVEYTRGLTVDAIVQRRGWAWPSFVDWVTERPIYAPLRQQLEVLACAC